MTNERDFKGVWIPKIILEQGNPVITSWVYKEYKIDLNLDFPLREDK